MRRIYEDTQEALRRRSILQVRLYRGLAAPYETPSILSSFTASLDMAMKFGPYGVIEENVPAVRIFAWYEGPGWRNGRFGQQFEYVVLSEEPR